MQNETIKPISINERIAYLDILRGLAIFFIFTANIPFFSGIWFINPEHSTIIYSLPTDKIIDFIMYALVDGKFYSIFSLLFGIGCVIQYNNLTSRGKAFAPFFRRRMFWLLVFGLIHMFLLWPGDILTLYALLGFLLIWFVKKSNKFLLITAVILILMPLANWAFLHFTEIYYPGVAFNQSTAIYQHFGMPVVELNNRLMPNIPAFLGNESISDFFKMSLGNGFIRIGRILDEGRAFKVLGIFLIGIWAGRKIIHKGILDNTIFLKKVFVIGVLIGLPINIFRAYIEYYSEFSEAWNLFHIIAYAFGTVPLALGYAAGIALLCKKGITILNWFKPVGKMALTCYLSQTVISIIVFYGFGFNLTGKYGFTYVMLIAFTIFIFQAIFSKVWLTYFKFGPMEWLWRKLTYGVKLKFKK